MGQTNEQVPVKILPGQVPVNAPTQMQVHAQAQAQALVQAQTQALAQAQNHALIQAHVQPHIHRHVDAHGQGHVHADAPSTVIRAAGAGGGRGPSAGCRGRDDGKVELPSFGFTPAPESRRSPGNSVPGNLNSQDAYLSMVGAQASPESFERVAHLEEARAQTEREMAAADAMERQIAAMAVRERFKQRAAAHDEASLGAMGCRPGGGGLPAFPGGACREGHGHTRFMLAERDMFPLPSSGYREIPGQAQESAATRALPSVGPCIAPAEMPHGGPERLMMGPPKPRREAA